MHHLHNPSDRHSLTQGRSAAGGRVAVWSIAGASTASTWHMWPPGVARVAGALHNHHLHSLWSQDSRPTGAAILPRAVCRPAQHQNLPNGSSGTARWFLIRYTGSCQPMFRTMTRCSKSSCSEQSCKSVSHEQ